MEEFKRKLLRGQKVKVLLGNDAATNHGDRHFACVRDIITDFERQNPERTAFGMVSDEKQNTENFRVYAIVGCQKHKFNGSFTLYARAGVILLALAKIRNTISVTDDVIHLLDNFL